MTDIERPWTAEEVAEAARARFWAKVDRRGPDECWPWLGLCNPKGCGWFQVAGSNLAHRFAVVLDGRSIPAGMVVRHSCDNPPCCNPRHLIVGTVAENNRDKMERGGWANGWTKNPWPECPSGHSKAVYARRHATNGKVWCLLCHRNRTTRRRERLRAAG